MRASSAVTILCVICLLLLAGAPVASASDFVFTEELLNLTQIAVRLSELAYSNGPVSSSDQTIYFFNEEPDQALVTEIDGYCFAAFRGTVITSLRDVFQNMQFGNRLVCDSSGGGACCNVERGFWQGYNANYRYKMEAALRDCTTRCTNSSFPVVLTGHSQGAAIAAVGALYLADLRPILITFAQPPTIDAPCDLINSDKYYRFENSRVRENRGTTTYDPVPYLPVRASHFGHQIMLGEDATSVAYIGKDTAVQFRPWDTDNGFASHRLTPSGIGYIHRIESIVAEYHYSSIRSYPVQSSGFVAGSVCSSDVECASKRCSNNICTTYRRLRG